MITTTNIEQAKKQIKIETESLVKPIIVKAQDDNFNRKMLEYGKFDVLLLHPSMQNKKPPLNNILAEIASRNNIAIGIDVEAIANLPKKEKAVELAGLIQTIKTCRKAKTRLQAINMNNINDKDKKGAFGLLTSLGASSSQAKQAASQ